jgi:hypothetical protein
LFKVNLNQIIEPKATPRSVKGREIGSDSLSPFLRNRDDPPFFLNKEKAWALGHI